MAVSDPPDEIASPPVNDELALISSDPPEIASGSLETSEFTVACVDASIVIV